MIRISGLSVKDLTNKTGDIEINIIGLRPGEKLFEELLISGDKLKTSNSKIFRSIEDYPNKEILTKVLDDLYNASISNDVITIRNILKENVEGFSEVSSEKK